MQLVRPIGAVLEPVLHPGGRDAVAVVAPPLAVRLAPAAFIRRPPGELGQGTQLLAGVGTQDVPTARPARAAALLWVQVASFNLVATVVALGSAVASQMQADAHAAQTAPLGLTPLG